MKTTWNKTIHKALAFVLALAMGCSFLPFAAFADLTDPPTAETYTLTFKLDGETAWKDGSLGLNGTASTEGFYTTYSFELPAGEHIALADYPVYCPADSHYGLNFWAVTPASGIGLSE